MPLANLAISIIGIRAMAGRAVGECERCDAMSVELASARLRIEQLEIGTAQLKNERDELRAHLAEMAKENELQKADLERLRKAAQESAPNHPERAAREELQLAFERVVETLDEATTGADDAGQSPTGSTESPKPSAPLGPPAGGPRRRHRHGRRRLDLSSLPVREVVVADAIVPEGFVRIGDEISERIALQRAGYFRLRLRRPKWVPVTEAAMVQTIAMATNRDDGDIDANPETESTGSKYVAPLPDGVWPRVMADPSAIAGVIVSKYSDCLPLNRQETISTRDGFRIPRSTQCGWLGAAFPYCQRIVDAAFKDAIATAPFIATDATSAPVRDKGKCSRWSVFVFVAALNHVVFRYAEKHNSDVIRGFLKGYRGPLVSDAAGVYDALHRTGDITESACWMHCRRYWYRAIETNRDRAFEALSLVAKLFEIDRECRALGLDVEGFARERAARARVIQSLFNRWVERYRETADPRGPLAAAFTYYDNQRDALWRFLDDGRLPIDNGVSERALRNLVLGNANWTFFANETGLKWYTTFRSLIASCALHRIHPQVYLEEILRLSPHWSQLRMLELTPKYWRQTRAALEPRFRSIIIRPWETELADIDLEPAAPPANPVAATPLSLSRDAS